MDNLFRVYLDNSLRMSIIILLFLLFTPIFTKKYSARWRYYTWLIVLIGSIIPLRPNLKIPIIKLEKELIIQKEMVTNLSTISITKVLSGIWILGVVVFLTFNILSYYKLLKTLNRWSYCIKDTDVVKTLQDNLNALQIKKNIEIMTCDFITSPMMAGLRTPKIILPNKQYNKIELSLIIKHELIHFKNKDFMYKLFLLFINALHWFNPIIYIMKNAILNECEMACDEEVLKNLDLKIRKTYGQIVFDAMMRHNGSKNMLLTNLYFSDKGIKSRFHSIMDYGSKKNGHKVSIIILILTILSGSLVICSTTKEKCIAEINKKNLNSERSQLEEAIKDKFKDEHIKVYGDRYEIEVKGQGVVMVLEKSNKK